MPSEPNDSDDFDLDDLLDEIEGAKGVPVSRSPKAQAAADRRAAEAARKQELSETARQLAQIVNLHISGMTDADIGAAIGMSADEVADLLASNATRFIRTQPALRVYVRNWISERMMKLVETNWDIAVDVGHGDHLEHQDRVMKLLVNMGRLHGAEAPTQSEVKVEASPANVDEMVRVLAAGKGLDYDVNVFDTVPGEVVHRAVVASTDALSVSGNEVGDSDGHDEL